MTQEEQDKTTRRAAMPPSVREAVELCERGEMVARELVASGWIFGKISNAYLIKLFSGIVMAVEDRSKRSGKASS
jgi:hypothetical protein